MERLLKFLHKLWNRAQPGLKRAFLLPPKVIAVLVPTTMVLCIAALNTQGKHPVLEMLIYLASAYALAVLVAGLGSITEAAARLLHGSGSTDGRRAIRLPGCSSATSGFAGSFRCIRDLRSARCSRFSRESPRCCTARRGSEPWRCIT